MRSLFIQPDVNTQIGVFAIDVGTRQILTRKAVDDGVFHLQRPVLAVADLFVQPAKVHGKSGILSENLGPWNGLYAKVQIQVAVYAALPQRQHNPRSQPAPHQALIQQPRISLKMDPALDQLAVHCAQPFQFSF